MQLAVHLTQRGYLIFYIKLSTDVWRVESVAVTATALPTASSFSSTMFTAFFFNSRVTQKNALVDLTIDNLSCYSARRMRFLFLSISPFCLNLNICESGDNYCFNNSIVFNSEIFIRSFPQISYFCAKNEMTH